MENTAGKLSDGKRKKEERQRKQQELKARRELNEAMSKKHLQRGEFATAVEGASVHDYFDVDEEIDPKKEGIRQADLSLVDPDVRERAESLLEKVARKAPSRSQARITDEFRTDRPDYVPTEEMIIRRAHSFVWTPGNARRDSNPIHLFHQESTASTALNALLEDRRYLLVEDRLSTHSGPEDLTLGQLIDALSKVLGGGFERVMIETTLLAPSSQQMAQLPPNHTLTFWQSKDSVREIMLIIVLREHTEGGYAEIITHIYVPPLKR